MSTRETVVVDANEAAATIAHKLSEVIAIYPITPSSAMGELADEWSAAGRRNLWGSVPTVVEMQSEGGAAGAVHGALQAGALATTFTASQGLLLMIPNLYKIAGELTPFCLHVSARTLATHALSIFGDHSDVMACRQAGLAMLCAGSVQEAHDFALVAHAATLRARVPFMHFFDGFRTSHELSVLSPLGDDDVRALVDDDLVAAHRRRGLSPDRPVLRGTAQNPDVFFQAREASNPFHAACPGIVADLFAQLGDRTGRRYALFDYVGHPEAERVVVLMGSGAEVAHETVDWLLGRGARVGVLKVRLYRPFDVEAFAQALPRTVHAVAVLDRTKEPGAVGEPLFQDVVMALVEDQASDHPALPRMPDVIGGRYGLSSKEFTPAMVKAVFDELGSERPRRRFTLGIVDDVTRLSLAHDRDFDIEPDDVVRCLFYGLGSDGTVSANKNSLKILADATGLFAQGYFVHDSKKAGAVTVSHLRFSRRPIRSSYLIARADFVACHQFHFLERFDVLEHAAHGGTFLLNAPWPANEIWEHLPREIQEGIIDKALRLFVVDAQAVAHAAGLKGRINTVMQACFFEVSGLMPVADALAAIRKGIETSYGRKGSAVLERNHAAVDAALGGLHEVEIPAVASSTIPMPPLVPDDAPDFVRRVTAVMMAGKGDLLPVSAFPVDGTWPVGTSRWEKRNLAAEIPVWDAQLCIQCNKCVFVCPHSAIRAKVYPPASLESAPVTFKSTPWKGNEHEGSSYSLQVAPEDCTGCTLCVMVCPAKDESDPAHRAIDMAAQPPLRERERANHAFFLGLPEIDRTRIRLDVKHTQLFQPLFEYSGACAGCGETPYLRLLTQLFGDRLIVANATGCSSIFGGNLPTTPYAANREGRGPAWCNSLFEDNAEFGLGMRLAVDSHAAHARDLLRAVAAGVGTELVDAILSADQSGEAGIAAQRERVEKLVRRLGAIGRPEAARLVPLADYLVRKSVWIVGGDGWAYDIGYGGLDHVLSLGLDVNILVLDTEVYSNTGGQASKATPLGAAAKFAVAGKLRPKKDLGMLAMGYSDVYVAQVAAGARDTHALKAMLEAESHAGPSLVVGFSPCIAHGYDLANGLEHQKMAVDVGYWPLYRFDPRRRAAGRNPFQLDSRAPEGDLAEYAAGETRFRVVERQDPEGYRELVAAAREHLQARWRAYERLAREADPIVTPK